MPGTYTATGTATVISSAGDAALSVADPSPMATGRLVNGAFSLTAPLLVAGNPLPTAVKTWTAPTSNEAVQIALLAGYRRQRSAQDGRIQQDAHVHVVNHEALT